MQKTPTSPKSKTAKSETPKFSSMAELLASAEELAGTNFFPGLKEKAKEPTIDDLKKELSNYKASADRLAASFSPYQRDPSKATPKPLRWLWQKRMPLSGITVLDGDHSCGKSLLALQLAACVSSGTPLPDGTPTIQGGVVIVTPTTDANSQLRLLSALGADLSRIRIISFLQLLAPAPHTGGYRPFTLPEDELHLFLAIKSVNARLVILDPFIHLLSRKMRITNERLCHLLADLNQRFIERNIACLLLRNCPAKGGHAKPSVLERSDHFASIAVSRLLLAPDPMQPDHLLLSHVHSRHVALTPTLILQIRRSSFNPDLPSLILVGTHELQARDLLENRPDTLHRRLLSQLLLRLITEANRLLHVTTVYELVPHSSPFQIQRSLADLLRTGQIQRPSRGFYTLATANGLNETAATTSNLQATNGLNETAATTSNLQATNGLNETAATTSNLQATNGLNETAATTSNLQATNGLNETAATTLAQTLQRAYREETSPFLPAQSNSVSSLAPELELATHMQI